MKSGVDNRDPYFNGRQHMDFGELSDVDMREAWPHEARDLTPWLSRNLDRLSSEIGIPLNLRERRSPWRDPPLTSSP